MKTTLILSLAIAGGLSAQTYTFPSDHASIANGSSNTTFFPYARGVSRLQAVYEAWDLLIPANTAISRIGFRQDGNVASTGHAVQVEVLMGFTTNTAANLSTTFANNYTGAMTTVFGPALFTLPNFTAAGGGTVWLDLTTPFTYSPPPGQNLLVEWRVTANNNGNASFTYYLDRATFDSPVVSGPVGCPHSGNNTAVLTSQPAKVGGNWNLGLTRAPASSLAILLQNPGRQLTPAYPLTPFIPGISGACTGQVSLAGLYVNTASTNSSGSKTWSIAIPNNPALNDVFVTSQCAILDLFAPGGIVVSNGDQMQVGIDPAQSIVYSQGSATATTGTVSRNYGVVTLFQ